MTYRIACKDKGYFAGMVENAPRWTDNPSLARTYESAKEVSQAITGLRLAGFEAWRENA